jgi:hypothetical protein
MERRQYLAYFVHFPMAEGVKREHRYNLLRKPNVVLIFALFFVRVWK